MPRAQSARGEARGKAYSEDESVAEEASGDECDGEVDCYEEIDSTRRVRVHVEESRSRGEGTETATNQPISRSSTGAAAPPSAFRSFFLGGGNAASGAVIDGGEIGGKRKDAAEWW